MLVGKSSFFITNINSQNFLNQRIVILKFQVKINHRNINITILRSNRYQLVTLNEIQFILIILLLRLCRALSLGLQNWFLFAVLTLFFMKDKDETDDKKILDLVYCTGWFCWCSILCRKHFCKQMPESRKENHE